MNYVIIDLETTGVEPELGDQILEVGAIRTLDGAEFHAIVSWPRLMGNAVAFKMNARLIGHPDAKPWKDVMVKLIEFVVGGCDHKSERTGEPRTTICAKNPSFELGFLKAHGFPVDVFHRRVLDPTVCCGLPGDKVLPEFKQCLTRVGIDPTKYELHSGLGDCRAMLALMQVCRESGRIQF